MSITSSKNLAFTKSLGLHDEVYSYDDFTSVPALHGSRKCPKQTKWIYADVSGSGKLNKKVYNHFESPYTGKLVMSVSLGMTTLTPASVVGAGTGDADTTSALLSANSGNVMSSGSTTMTGEAELYPKLENSLLQDGSKTNSSAGDIKRIWTNLI